jgi:hypothetical protein
VASYDVYDEEIGGDVFVGSRLEEKYGSLPEGYD